MKQKILFVLSSCLNMKQLFGILISLFVAFMAKAQSCPDDGHPHAIDLGLPSGTKWSCCNIGATTPEGCGSFYAWGETEEKEKYDWSTYLHCDGTMDSCRELGSDIAGTEYDVAHVQWGGSWVMPSVEQIQELLDNCSYTWTTIEGVTGAHFIGSNGASIFLPETDIFRNSRLVGAGISDNNDNLNRITDELPNAGYYWSSTPSPSNPNYAYNLLFSYNNTYWDSYNYRCLGLAVRPVISETANIIHQKLSTNDTSHTIYCINGLKVTDRILEKKALRSGCYIINGHKQLINK